MTMSKVGDKLWQLCHTLRHDGIPFLRSQNVRPMRFKPEGVLGIPATFHASLSKSRLMGGELLVTRSGANTGQCCVYPPGADEANCSDLVITRLLPILNPFYACLYVNSPLAQARLNDGETGIAQPHFNIGAMRIKPVPLPPTAEQTEIVSRVDSLMKLADAIERRVALAQSRADKVTQSILARAFRGELVTSDSSGAWERNQSAATTDTKVCDLGATSHKSEPSDHANGREGPTPRVRERSATRAKSR